MAKARKAPSGFRHLANILGLGFRHLANILPNVWSKVHCGFPSLKDGSKILHALQRLTYNTSLFVGSSMAPTRFTRFIEEFNTLLVAS